MNGIGQLKYFIALHKSAYIFLCHFALLVFVVERRKRRQACNFMPLRQQQDRMELSVQNQLLHHQFLSKIAFNGVHNLLAAIADGADTVSFFHYQPHPAIFTEIFTSSSRPSGKKSSLAWSPNGLFLSLGSAHLQLWKLEDHKLVPLKNYNDDFIDIKIIAWSPDSNSMAFGGLSKKNAIKVRSLDGATSGQLVFDLTISAISYDPFGKYLLVLARSNILYVYNCTSLTKLREVPLSPNAHPLTNISTVKEIRGMSWSPDFNYLVSPSLDDNKVSLAFAMCRSQNFKTTHAFIGHASSISCASFSPNLYEWQGEPCSILALGDSHGSVSIWRISSKASATPLLVSNSKTDYNQVVEQLEWSSTGDVLFVNLMKRYISILSFKKQCLGREISIEEKSNIIESNFGVMSAAEINKKELEIFSFDAVHALGSKHQNASQEPVALKPDSYNFSQRNQERLGDKVEYVKINQQVTIKDKNNRKKIQPAVLVRKEQAQKKKEASAEVMNAIIPAASFMPVQYKPLNLKPLAGEVQLGRISSNRYIQLKKIQNYSILQLLQFKEGEFSVLNQRTFIGSLQYVKNIQRFLYVCSKGNLFIFDCELNLQELPVCLGELHKLAINSAGDIYLLTVQGFIRGFNHIKHICYTPSSVPIHTLIQVTQSAYNSDSQEKKESQVNQVKAIQLFTVESDHNLYVTVSETEQRYFFDRQSACWISLQLNKGLLKPGHSLKVTDLQQKLIEDFFRKINGKIEPEQPKGQTAIQQYQANLIYYKKHNPNRQLFKENLIGLIRQLKLKGMSEKLRSILTKYFSQPLSQFHQNDQLLRSRVRSLGGNVIQQFVYFKKI